MRKTQPAFSTALFHDKFTLWHINYLNIEKEISSHKQYLFGLLFSGSTKKTHIDQSITQFV